MGRVRSGRRRPQFGQRSLERIRVARRQLAPEAETPQVVAQGFQRRRTTFDINIQEVFRRPGNGLRQKVSLNRSLVLENQYQLWLRQVGQVGDPGVSRAEFMVFRSLERRGLRCPESRPPGLDFEYLARVRGNRGGIEIDMLIHQARVAIRVQGEYWHFKDDPTIEAGLVERALLETQGFKVVDILAQDTVNEQRCDYVVSLALNGFEVDQSGKLGVFR